MGAAAGPDLISNGLVLMLDVANVKSCQGESTTNLSYNNGRDGSEYLAAIQSWVNAGAWTSNNNETDVPKPIINGLDTSNLRIMSGIVTSTGSIHFGCSWVSISPSTTYAVSVYYRQNNTVATQPYIRTNINNNTLALLSYNGNTNTTTWPVNQWIRISATGTTQSNEDVIYISNYISDVGQKIWYFGHQFEQKDHITSLVAGTRNTISDISGNQKHHTMVNTPIYSDEPPKFTLNDTNGFTSSSITTSTTCTVVIYYKTTDTTELWVRGQTGNYYIAAATTGSGYYHENSGSPTYYVDKNVVTDPISGGYRDGNYHMWEAKNVNFSSWTGFNWFLHGGSWNMTGSVSMIMVYNRNLTTTESAQNFNALKNRYMPIGSIAAMSANSAQDIKARYSSAPNGTYWINLPTVGPTQIYCIMDSAYDGGGWMMMMKATAGTTFNYDATYWTTNNTLNPTDITQNNADAKYNTMNYYSGKDLMARWPDISNVGGESGSIDGLSNWTWLENNFNNGDNVVPINFFANPSSMSRYYSGTYGGSGNFIKDAKTYSGWASGVFSSQVDIRFYGFNYTGYSGINRVRWGFGWNENGDGLFPSVINGASGSNDVSGGIGMDSNNRGGYSAGDHIGCCQDTTGINRSARVEVYIR